MTRLVVLLLGAFLLVPGGAAAQPAPVPAPVPDPVRLQALLDAVVAAGAPGAAMYVLQNGEDVALGSGFAAVETQRPMTASRRYRIGSVTKSYVATTVLQLVEEERLALTDTVEQRLPGVLPYGSRITVRQLLQHRSGVPDYFGATPLGDYLTGGPAAMRVWTPLDLVGLVAAQPPAFEPGSAWGYSNTNYVLLGLIVERVTRRSLAAELDRRLLRPLALDDTDFLVADEDVPNPRARGYAAALGPDGQPTAGLPTVVPGFHPSIAWAAGNMTSDVEDVADFYAFLLGGRFLSEGLLTEMKAGGPTTVPGLRYGGGLMVRELPCGTVYGHDGGIFGFANVALSSEDGTHQVVLEVSLFPATPAVAAAVDAAVVGAYCPGAPGANVGLLRRLSLP
jgi:D-alanyl-D-alanine carboxypeptidase